MRKVLILSYVLIIGCIALGQCKPDVFFKGAKIDSIYSNNLQDLISRYFRSSFFTYFDSSCGQYYDLYDFKVSKEGKIQQFSHGRPESKMSKFIWATLQKTEGNWGWKNCENETESKWVVLPMYFIFADECDEKLYTERLDLKRVLPKPINIDGFSIQNVNANYIVLAPISLLGPLIEVGWKPDKKQQAVHRPGIFLSGPLPSKTWCLKVIFNGR
jgi:hypothetical protein